MLSDIDDQRFMQMLKNNNIQYKNNTLKQNIEQLYEVLLQKL